MHWKLYTKLLLAVFYILLVPQQIAAQERNMADRLQVGDLLFYRDSAGMGAAVRETTGSYSHVAIVASVGDTVWIVDATQRRGVSCRPLRRTVGVNFPDVYRLIVPFDTAATIARALQLVGLPYDNAFLPDNEAYYCSELVQACYLDGAGKPLFESRPMNWRNARGRIPRYWKKHFRALKMKVPEGALGTNPTDMAHSPLLKIAYLAQ